MRDEICSLLRSEESYEFRYRPSMLIQDLFVWVRRDSRLQACGDVFLQLLFIGEILFYSSHGNRVSLSELSSAFIPPMLTLSTYEYILTRSKHCSVWLISCINKLSCSKLYTNSHLKTETKIRRDAWWKFIWIYF